MSVNKKRVSVLIVLGVICFLISVSIYVLLSSGGAYFPAPPTSTTTPRPIAAQPSKTDTVEPTFTPSPTGTPTETLTATNTPGGPSVTPGITQPSPATYTPIPEVVLQATLEDIDAQLQQSIESNIVFIVPISMKLDETAKVELMIDLSASPEELMTVVVENSGYATSTAEAGKVVTRQGGEVLTQTEVIKVAESMQAELKAGNPNDFVIVERQSPIQVISRSEPTTWIWDVTAKERGNNKILTLTISRLLKVQGEDQWRPLKSYEKDITVKVTPIQWITDLLDWKWLIGILVTALFIPLFFRWYDARKKAESPATSSESAPSPEKPKNTRKKKK